MIQYIKKAVACCFVLLLFVGCQSENKVPKVTYPFSCSVVITNPTVTAEGTFTARLPGCYTLQITKPAYLNGMTMDCQGGQPQVVWDDWFTSKEAVLPYTSVFAKLTSVLDHVARSDHPNQLTQTTAIYCVDEHTAVCDRVSGRPLQLWLQDSTQVTMTYE